LRQRAIQAAGDAGIAGAELNRLMGDPVEREVVAVEPSTSTLEDVAGQRDVTALLAEADAARPELKRAAASARTAEAAQRQARARESVVRAAVEQARESQRIVRDRFAAGIAPVNDVLRASASVLEADANRISALADAIVANAMLRRALGHTP